MASYSQLAEIVIDCPRSLLVLAVFSISWEMFYVLSSVRQIKNQRTDAR